jgi:hypothetical protein
MPSAGRHDGAVTIAAPSDPASAPAKPAPGPQTGTADNGDEPSGPTVEAQALPVW